MTNAATLISHGFSELAQQQDVRSTILVVDDEPELLIALEDLLGDDYRVITTRSGKEALEITSDEPDITVVLSDQRMPFMQGDELLARLNETSDASRILVTGYADLTAVVRAVNEGRLFAYLSKPWDEEALRLTVQRAAQHCLLQRELMKERTMFRDLMDSIPDGVYVKDGNLRLSRTNRAYVDLLSQVGAAPGNETNLTEDLAALWLDQDAIDMRRAEQNVLRTGQISRDIICSSHTPGQVRHYSTSHAPLWGKGNRVEGVVGVVRDVTERRAQEDRIFALSRIRKLMSEANGAMVRTRGRVALLERCCRVAVEHGDIALACALTRRADGEKFDLAAIAVKNGLSSADLAPALLELGAHFTTEWLPEHTGPLVCNASDQLAGLPGATRLAESGLAALAMFPAYSDDGLDCIYTLAASRPDFFDVEEVNLLLELTSNVAFALEHEAKSVRLDFVTSYDQVTGLARRELFSERLKQHAVALLHSSLQIGVLWVDLSRFRQVNETLGRSSGNELLRLVGERLTERMGDVSTIARLDANAFGLITPPCRGESDVLEFVDRIVTEAFQTPFLLRGRELRLSGAIGISICPTNSDDPDKLLSRAETACKTAKARNQQHLFYAEHMDHKASERLDLENRLRSAIERDEYLLHYQPKVHAKTGAIVGLEGLIRWREVGGNLVPPGVFIPVLEETGLILEVGVWVVQEAARQYASWLAKGLNPPRIAVNVSAIQLENPRFVDSVLETFARYPQARGGIDLEITESAVMGDFEANMSKLQTLRQAGLCIAIDDFGTGYSSLAYLSRLPADALKIDRSFVDKMGQNPQDMSIVTTIISLAHALDLKVIAEGVETNEQARMLALLKCDQLQGYLLSRPLPADAIPPLLEAPDTLAQKLYPKATKDRQ